MKKEKYQSEEQKELKTFIIVVIGLVIILVGIYFFTRAFITKDLFNKESNEITYSDGSVDYDVCIVGNMLSRPYNEYYVIAFSNEDLNANYYNTVVSKYTSLTDALKIYYIDLDNVLNGSYIANDDNISSKFTTIDELKLGDITLFKVKNKKVTKMITNMDDIIKELNV